MIFITIATKRKRSGRRNCHMKFERIPTPPHKSGTLGSTNIHSKANIDNTKQFLAELPSLIYRFFLFFHQFHILLFPLDNIVFMQYVTCVLYK